MLVDDWFKTSGENLPFNLPTSDPKKIEEQWLIMVLEYAEQTLAGISKQCTLEEWRIILFQIIYALSIAQQELCFVHHDFHFRNILLTKTDSRCTVYFDEDTFWVVSGWKVSLTDFGHCRMRLSDWQHTLIWNPKNTLTESYTPSTDLLKLSWELSICHPTNSSTSDPMEVAMYANFRKYLAMGTHSPKKLLRHPFFFPLRANQLTTTPLEWHFFVSSSGETKIARQVYAASSSTPLKPSISKAEQIETWRKLYLPFNDDLDLGDRRRTAPDRLGNLVSFEDGPTSSNREAHPKQPEKHEPPSALSLVDPLLFSGLKFVLMGFDIQNEDEMKHKRDLVDFLHAGGGSILPISLVQYKAPLLKKTSPKKQQSPKKPVASPKKMASTPKSSPMKQARPRKIQLEEQQQMMPPPLAQLELSQQQQNSFSSQQPSIASSSQQSISSQPSVISEENPSTPILTNSGNIIYNNNNTITATTSTTVTQGSTITTTTTTLVVPVLALSQLSTPPSTPPPKILQTTTQTQVVDSLGEMPPFPVILLSPRPVKSGEYLLSFVKRVPAVHSQWIIDCALNNQRFPLNQYLLAMGYDSKSKTFIQPHSEVVDYTSLTTSMTNLSQTLINLFERSRVEMAYEKNDSNDWYIPWRTLLDETGAHVIERLHKDDPKLAAVVGSASLSASLVETETKMKCNQYNIPFVNVDWIVQSILTLSIQDPNQFRKSLVVEKMYPSERKRKIAAIDEKPDNVKPKTITATPSMQKQTVEPPLKVQKKNVVEQQKQKRKEMEDDDENLIIVD